MSRKTLGKVALWGALCFGGYQATAVGQGWNAPPAGYGGYASPVSPVSYGAGGEICPPVAQVSQVICPPVQQVVCPVVQQVTHVPVTEMRECRQTVQRPVVETQYVEQPVTAYRPVVETQTAQVATVNYQNVTDCQTRTRDLGQWVTNYRCRPTMSPCEYDGRPGLAGWLNRTSYSTRMAFTPKLIAERTYVPNVVTENIPVTRQVAIPGVRQVSYQVTRMIPYTTTRKVAVNSVRMVAQEVVTHHAVTVMRPVGSSSIVLGPTSGTASASLQPIAEPSSSTARATTRVPPREANAKSAARTEFRDDDADAFESKAREPIDEQPRKTGIPAKKSSLTDPSLDEIEDPRDNDTFKSSGPTAANHPTAVVVGRWVARRRPATESTSTEATITVAATSHKLGK